MSRSKENNSRDFFWRHTFDPFNGSRKDRQKAVRELHKLGLIKDGMVVNGTRLLKLADDLIVPGRPLEDDDED